MHWSIIVVLAAIIVYGIWAGKKSYENSKRLVAEGKLTSRKADFYKYKETIVTTASFDDVYRKICETDFSDTNSTPQSASGSQGNRAVLFQSAAWNAVLADCGMKENRSQFELYFSSWKTDRNGIVNTISMNVLLTTIEKIILSLDAKTTVETSKMEIKSQTKFF